MKAVIAIAAALLIGCAQAASQWEMQTTSRVDEKTETFVKKAAQSGMGEVELSRWALTRTDDAEFRKLAQHMIDDHTKANAELRQIAERLGVSVPTPMTDDQMDLQKKLDGLRAAEFRREFVNGAKLSHEKSIDLFNDYSKNGENADVRAFAEKYLPVIKNHLAMLKDFGGTSMQHSDSRHFEASYSSDDRFHSQHSVSYERPHSSTFVTSDVHFDDCGECVSYDPCNECEPSGEIVYENDWRAGTTDFVTGEQHDLEECAACDWAESMWR
ncbi:MAG TPA: DUF4142 domain-containing protein [Planctomycetota bacterium]|nr:DUF4142 domain-containing protein [Planctomycetota bacterium]